MNKKALRMCIVLLGLFIFAAALYAEPETADPASAAVMAATKELQTNINIVWTCVAAFLVFFMQAGFAMVEAGFTRAKNAVNISMKNLMDFSIGSLVYFLIGFGLMFGTSNGFFGTTLFGLSGTEPGETLELDVSDFPDGFCRDVCDDCLRSHGGADEVHLLPDL
jgi:hypothetical protein